MGINQWYAVFNSSAVRINEKDFKGKCIGIDASYDIFRSSLGMLSVNSLTDSSGQPTLFLNTLLSNIVRYRSIGVKGLIYIFDNPVPNPMKRQEHKKRNTARKKAELKHAEKQCFKINDQMIADVHKMLTLLGISWITAPFGYEAEHLGAELSKSKIIDIFITSDSDTLLFGGNSFARHVGKKREYDTYCIDKIMTDFSITREQLVHLGVVMGSDFNEKTAGIGVKTILKKGLEVKLTESQQLAKDYFLKSCPFSKDNIISNTKTDKSITDCIDWLVKDKGFNRNRITKLLSRYGGV